MIYDDSFALSINVYHIINIDTIIKHIILSWEKYSMLCSIRGGEKYSSIYVHAWKKIDTGRQNRWSTFCGEFIMKQNCQNIRKKNHGDDQKMRFSPMFHWQKLLIQQKKIRGCEYKK